VLEADGVERRRGDCAGHGVGIAADASDRRRATRIWGLAPGWDLFADVRDLLLELFPGESVEEILVVGGQLARQKIQVFLPRSR
jgi:hypothetical protein